MDYGHTPKTSETPDDNLNLENWNAVSHQPFSSSRTPVENPFAAHPLPAPPAPLGQIIPMEPPQTSPEPLTSEALGGIPREQIRAENDHIGAKTLEALEATEAKLDQTGDLANFYDQIRGLGDTYRENSFGAKPHEGEGES